MDSTDRTYPATSSRAVYLWLFVPATFFIIAVFIRPQITFDSAYGFLALRSMLDGGPFNYVISPDPKNIADNIKTLLTWWSPGQYLVPGIFVLLGASYGLAISLSTLIASLLGVLGWARLAQRFEVSKFILLLFVAGLVTFRYTTVPFAIFNGGDVVLSAALPWSLSALLWTAQKRPAACFTVSLLTAAVLFFAKLSGIIVFVATCAGIGSLELVRQRQLTPRLLAMAAGAAVAAILLFFFWLARGATPGSATGYVQGHDVTWPRVFFPIAAATFSGFSALDFLEDLYLLVSRLLHSAAPILSEITVNGYASYVLGPLGLLLMGWVWLRLRGTRYRPMISLLFPVIAFYIAAYIAMYVRSANLLLFEERYFYYAGILSFLLLLVAMDQWRASSTRVVPLFLVGLFAVYGMVAYAHEALRSRNYDKASGIAMIAVPPRALAYLRSEMAAHDWPNAIAVVPLPEAAVGLPHFRILFDWNLLDSSSLEAIAAQKWAGRTDKIFVIIGENALTDGKAEAVLKAFVDYDFTKWDKVQIDGVLVYSQ